MDQSIQYKWSHDWAIYKIHGQGVPKILVKIEKNPSWMIKFKFKTYSNRTPTYDFTSLSDRKKATDKRD